MSEKKPFDVRDAVAKILVEQNRIERLEAKAAARAKRAEDMLRMVANGTADAKAVRMFLDGPAKADD